MYGYASLVTALLSAGANLEAKESYVRRVGCGYMGVGYLHFLRLLACVLQAMKTPLDYAQSKGHAEVVALLQAAAAAPARS